MLRRHHKDEGPAAGRATWPGPSSVKATGKVLVSPDAPPGASGPTFLATAGAHDYLIEIPAPDGTMIRTTVSTFSRIVHQVGAPIHVEIESRTGTISVDHHAMSLVATKLMKEHAAEIPGSAARARARRDTPGTFDPIPGSGTAGGLADPVVTPFAEPAGPFGFDVPPPDAYPSVSPPEPGAGGFSPGGSFDFGPGQGSTDQQLAHLRQLLDKGILTESEYQEQARQVRGG
ncbi:MAG TPA: SHOCT domain-containing protein [Streptosporangiaceae bacterium]